uniref:Uncharacterized protein n=1 Tax=Rhizophora mucronata TaxID=61149 RepID=A0A2P2J5X3_RHIMU
MSLNHQKPRDRDRGREIQTDPHRGTKSNNSQFEIKHTQM